MNPTPSPPSRGALPGVLLLAGSCLSALAAVLLAPVLPQLQEQFASSPLPPALILSAPALMIALFAPFAGQIVDRTGRRNLLLVAMVVYAVVGTAVAWLPESLVAGSIGPVLVLRLLVGLAEAAIMTCCTTLIADYYRGDRRNRYLGLQTVFTTIAATIFIVVGGVLGAAGWRAPFWAYALSIVIVVPMFFVLDEPAPDETERAAERAAAGRPIPWRTLWLPLVTTVFGGCAFFVLLSQSALVYSGVGITDTQQIGLLTAGASVATAIGSIAFARLARFTAKVLLPVALGLLGAGLVLMWLTAVTSTVPGVVAGAVLGSLGSGLLLPTMLVWAVGRLGFAERGRATGLWTAAFFLGQFVSPLIVQAVQAVQAGADPVTSLPPALGAIGLACGAAAVILVVVVRRDPLSEEHDESLAVEPATA
jgi:MFS family permease